MTIELDGVGHRYRGGPWLFRGVSWSFAAGSLTALTGPSGSGKSTLLAILGGLVDPAEGTVAHTNGDDARAAWVFQAPSGIPRRTAVDHVAFPVLAAGGRRRDAEAIAARLLDDVGLTDRAGDDFRRLSGGEAQRVALARAIATDRPVILADEPTAQLDRAAATTVADALGRLTAEGRVVIVATHDPTVVDRCPAVLDLTRWPG